MTSTRTHTLSDQTTIRIRRRTGIIGTEFQELPSRNRKAGTMLRIGDRMYLVLGPRQDLVPVSNPDYQHAKSNAEGERKALAFFVQAAEDCIKHAAEHRIPVEDCYST